MGELRQELTGLRNDARRAQHEADSASGPVANTAAAPETAVAGGGQVARSIQSGPWRFGDREVITLDVPRLQALRMGSTVARCPTALLLACTGHISSGRLGPGEVELEQLLSASGPCYQWLRLADGLKAGFRVKPHCGLVAV
jgi:hypothetical protein